MICKFCREDLPATDFKLDDYQKSRANLKFVSCTTCLKTPPASKKAKKAAMREVMRKVYCNDREKLWHYCNNEQRATLQHANRTKWEWKLDEAMKAEAMKFIPQHPCGPYWLDFAFVEQKLAIEIDGSVHGTEKQQKHDERRTKVLSSMGWEVIRFSNSQVQNNLDEVLKRIKISLLGRGKEKALRPHDLTVVYVPPKSTDPTGVSA